MKPKTRGAVLRTQLLVMVIVAILVVGGFGYFYFSTQSQITSLRSENQTLCTQLSSLAGATQRFYDNLTAVLRGWNQNDNSLIQALNESKPPGSAGMINLLRVQVEVSSLLLGALSKPVSIGSNSCNE